MSEIVKKKTKKIQSKPSILGEKLDHLERPSTFEDVFNYLCFVSEDIKNIEDFRILMNHEKYSKQEFEKQETFFRLFAFLGLIPEFHSYQLATFDSNVSENHLDFFMDHDDFYFQLLKKEKMKDSGDSSDLTLYNSEKREIILSTSKNYADEYISLRKLDLEKIQIIFDRLKSLPNDHFPIEKMKLCIMIPSKKILMKKMETCRQENLLNMELSNMILDDNTLIMDWNDLYSYFKNFEKMYIMKGVNSFDDLFTLGFAEKRILQMKFHQELTYFKTNQLLKSGIMKMIWGHVCRSGKSFMIGDLIYRHSSESDEMMNYLILTTAPSETLKQYQDIFTQYSEFNEFQLISLHETNSWKLKKNNIFLCSIQRIRNLAEIKHSKQDENSLLKSYRKLFEVPFDIMFVDEAHQGGITDLACKLYDKIHAKHTIFVTATYTKPMEKFKIQKDHSIVMDLYDYSLMKELNNEVSRIKICERFQIPLPILNEMISKYDIETICEEYRNVPKLHFLTWKPNQVTLDHIFEEQRGGIEFAGLSIDSIFTLRQNNKGENTKVFQHDEQVQKFLIHMFGYKKEEGKFKSKKNKKESIPGFIERIEKIRRFEDFYEDTHGHKDIILCFLPCGGIHQLEYLSDTLMDCMNRMMHEEKMTRYRVMSIHSKKNKGYEAKELIQREYSSLHEEEEGLIVFSGRQCHLGVTLEDCDIVMLLNNTQSLDTLYQMMFRGASSRMMKKNAFVIDVNVQRNVEMIVDLSIKSYSNLGIKESVSQLLRSHVIEFNEDNWGDYYDSPDESINIDKIAHDVFQTWSLNQKSCFHLLIRDYVSLSEIPIGIQKELDMYLSVNLDKRLKKEVSELSGDPSTPSGVQKIRKKKEDEESTSEDEESTEGDEEYIPKIDFVKDVLSYLLPMMCILTIRTEIISFEEMYEYIQHESVNGKLLIDFLLHQIKIRWPKIEPREFMDFVRNLYISHYHDHDKILILIKRMKELFMDSLNDIHRLSTLVDEYLRPSEDEESNNAEFSTPYALRQEMLDQIPIEFWRDPNHKVFEPCSGKAGFLIDIIDRFMKGLSSIIEDEKVRYQHIVENCIYFADINPMNLYLGELLINPTLEFKTNSWEGDTLTLDIEEVFKMKGFHLVIGNPPFNMGQQSSGKKGGGDLLWNKFVLTALNEWVLDDNFLMFVHPSGWRKPPSDRSKYKNMFELMTHQNQMIYLEIHDTKDGMKTFHCGTRYDWYLIHRQECYQDTVILDEKGVKTSLDLREWNFLPNYAFTKFDRIMAKNEDETVNILFSCSFYETRKKWVHQKENEEFQYPLIHSTPKSGIRYYYTNDVDKGFFGIPKVIFGDSGINQSSIIDSEGIYGMTQHAMAISENIEHLKEIKRVIDSKDFGEIIDACSWSNFQIDWRLFTYLKNDFWKYF
jgi:hypothetical protein